MRPNIQFKKWAGIGLIGQLSRRLSRARKEGTSISGEISCHISVHGPDKFCFRALIQRDSGPVGDILGPAFSYEFISRSFFEVLSTLTKEVAESRNEFPKLRFIRIFHLPTSDHKLQYHLRAAKLGEAWLEYAINASASRPHHHEFEIREEFVNGTWLPYQDEASLHLKLSQAKCLIENGGFQPFICHTKVVNESNPPYVTYALAQSLEAILAEGKIYIYPYDFWFDLYPAINCERERHSKAGIEFDPPDIDLRTFLDNCEYEKFLGDFEFEEEDDEGKE